MAYRRLDDQDQDDAKSYGSISIDAVDAVEDAADAPNPFADAATAEHWRQVYARSGYEGRHVFDPALTWSAAEERRLVRTLDRRVCLWACVMFFALQVDRNNLGQAVSDNLLDDLGLDTNDYNYGHAIFLLAFLLAELPSQLVAKALGPDRWVPTQMVLWSLVAMAQCGLTGRASFYVTRGLLGLLEGGFIPALVLWLSYFYTARELPLRLAYFWTTLSATGIVTSVAAAGLLRLRGLGGWAGWRWLFLAEGFVTLLVGAASFARMPASAVRPRGWLSHRQAALVVNRVLRDDPRKGDSGDGGDGGDGGSGGSWRRLRATLGDVDLWPLYALGLVAFVPQAPPKTYLTLTLRALGFGTLATNLLTIPADLIHIVSLLLLTRLSERLDQRALVALLQPLWTLPCVVALWWWPGLGVDRWGTYGLVTVLLSYPYCHAILVGWCSKNSGNVHTRTVSAALYNMSVQTGGIFSAYVYRDDDKPLYRRGNATLVAVNVLSIVLFLVAKAYYVWRNRQKERLWRALTAEQQVQYRKTTRHEGSQRLDFRFAH